MKVAKLHAKHEIRLHDEPMPVAGPHDELIKVSMGGICGSDLHWYAEGSIGTASLTQPLVLGHEYVGVIASGKNKGKRIVVEPSGACGVCEQCLAGNPNLCQNGLFAGYSVTDGSFREYTTWPSHLLFDMPDDLSDEEGSMLEPLCNGLMAIDLGHMRAGKTAAVFGCGPIGLVTMQAAKAAGATAIFATDKLPHRLEAARRLGATDVFMADGSEIKKIMAATKGRGVDTAFECAGDNAAVDAALDVALPGGRVVLVGIPVENRVSFTFSTARGKGLTLLVQRRSHPEYPRAIRLIRSGLVEVKSIVSDAFPLSQAAEAFDFAEKRKGLKVVITP